MAILAFMALLAIFCLPLYCLYAPAPVPGLPWISENPARLCRESVAKGFADALAVAVTFVPAV